MRTESPDDDLPPRFHEGGLAAFSRRFFHGGTDRVTFPGGWQASVTRSVTVAAGAIGIAGAALSGVGGAPVLALLTVAILGLASVVVLYRGGLRMFGVVHLVYLLLTVALPLVGLALAARVLATDGLGRPGTLAVGVLLALPAAIGAYATHVEPYRLRVDRATLALPQSRTGHDPVRIGILADLQADRIGAHEQKAVALLLAAAPDVILLPGDLFQGTDEAFATQEDQLRDLLGQLDAPGGVFVVRGDTDPRDRTDRATAGTKVVILDDEIVDVQVGDRSIRLGGNRLAYHTPEAAALRRELAEDDDAGGTVRILLAHRPDAVLDLPPASRVDLTVAGHTHGGQVVVPGFGPLVTLTSVPRHVARGGLHRVNGNPIYVSNGVGVERAQAPQIRLFSPPSVGIVELT